MTHSPVRVALALMAVLTIVSVSAFAQGGGTSTSLNGTVVDGSGAVIPGADIKLKNNGTSAEYTAVSAEGGTFTIPALPPGTYTATVSLMGFKTYIVNDIVLSAGVPGTIRPVLQVGGLEETVTVQGGSEIVQTSSATVATTINASQIQNVALASRNALDFIGFLPGVNTPAGIRDSTVNGLPQSAINITLDGASVQDNYLKTSDGFFARLSPRIDAVEEVTVTSAANGADTGGQGAIQIRFTTKSGTNRFVGSAYHYYRNDALNSNTWFNNRDLAPVNGKAPKSDLLQNQPGVRLGGPVTIPGLYNGHDKMFFFVNYEQNRVPSLITRNRTILSPLAQQGTFEYTTSSGVQQKNLLDLVPGSTLDPAIAKVFADIRAASGKGTITTLTDPSTQRATFQLTSNSITPAPTVRLDYNLSTNHRLTGSVNYQHINSNPDTTNNREPVFPGFTHTGSQQSTRYSTSESLRSTLGANLVNELQGGATGGATFFSPELNASMWTAPSIPDQLGFNLAISTASSAGISNPASTTGGSSREGSTKFLQDTMSWIRGSHSLTFGGAWTRVDVWLQSQTIVPTINFGIATGDPADALLVAGVLPGASATQVTAARNLFAVLTGRVLSITNTARLDEATNKYVYSGSGLQRGRMHEWGFFAQDSWRWKPNLTVNYGVRYEIQMPFYPLNDSYLTATVADVWGISGVGNLFNPKVQSGQKPTFKAFSKGTKAFNTDTNNFAPNLGLNWTPHSEWRFLRPILGAMEGDSSFRAGYSLAYTRGGMSDYTDVFGANPGVSIDATRSQTNNNLGTVPLLLSQRDRLGPASFPEQLTLPFTDVQSQDINIFDPNIQTPYSQTWTAGWQRKLSRDMAVELRYVGSRNLQGWGVFNFNEPNIVENGFLDEFRRAQANLQANIAAGPGRGCIGGVTTANCQNNFAYTGAPGTSPLPIYLAYLNGFGASQAADITKYSGASWSSTNFTNALAIFNPNPFAPAAATGNTAALNAALQGDATRRQNALNAGLPANFFVANPDLLGGANLTTNTGYTRYDAMQLELRKRISRGFQFQANYVYGNQYESSRTSFRKPRLKRYDTGTPGNVTHAFKGSWVYELPFGRGRAFASNAGGVLDRIVGGWELDGGARLQSGRLVNLGNVRLNGMSRTDVEKMFKLRFDDAGKVVYMLPQDVIDNTVKAFSVSSTSLTGYGSQGAPTGRYFSPANGPDCIEVAAGFGDCGTGDLVVTGPRLVRFDLSAVKRTTITSRVNFEFRVEMLNAFNHPYFTPVGGLGNTPDDYRVTAADSGRTLQLVSRVNW